LAAVVGGGAGFGVGRVVAEKNRSRSFGSAEKRFAQDDIAFFELSSPQRGRLAGPYFVFGIFVGGIAAVGDESPTYQSSPDARLVSSRSWSPRSPNARDRGAPDRS
jgi:hypothetical protein